MTCDIQTQQLEIIVIAMRMVQMVGDWGCLWHLIRAWKILKYTLPFGKAAIPFCFCREHWMHILVYDLVRRWLAWYLAIGQMSKKTYKGSGIIGQDLFWANMGKSDLYSKSFENFFFKIKLITVIGQRGVQSHV